MFFLGFFRVSWGSNNLSLSFGLCSGSEKCNHFGQKSCHSKNNWDLAGFSARALIIFSPSGHSETYCMWIWEDEARVGVWNSVWYLVHRSVVPAAEWWRREQLPAVKSCWALILKSALLYLENQHCDLVPDLPCPSIAVRYHWVYFITQLLSSICKPHAHTKVLKVQLGLLTFSRVWSKFLSDLSPLGVVHLVDKVQIKFIIHIQYISAATICSCLLWLYYYLWDVALWVITSGSNKSEKLNHS